jgi:hypothetical protein
MVGLGPDAGEARGVLVASGGLGHEHPRVHLLQGTRSPGADAYFVTQRQPSKHYELKRCKTEYAEVDFKKFPSQHYFIGMCSVHDAQRRYVHGALTHGTADMCMAPDAREDIPIAA